MTPDPTPVPGPPVPQPAVTVYTYDPSEPPRPTETWHIVYAGDRVVASGPVRHPEPPQADEPHVVG